MELSQEEQQCCGSGCTNCVLDLKPRKHTIPAGKRNLLDSKYHRFVCKSIVQQTEHVFRFSMLLEEPWKHHESDGQTSASLIVPPGCHLYLRAPKLHIPAANGTPDEQLQAWRKRNAAHSLEHRTETGAKEKYDKTEEDLFFCRPYTPISCESEEKSFDVLIKMEPGGRMTEYLLTLATGSYTEWKGVYGDFAWIRNQYRNVVGFVQGVAIAPIYSAMRAILADEEDYTRLLLCACFQDLPNVLLREELRSMAGYWNFKYEVFLSRRSCTCQSDGATPCVCVSKRLKYNEPINDRRLHADDVERLVAPYSRGTESMIVLLCGTESFTMFIKSVLARLKIENCYTF